MLGEHGLKFYLQEAQALSKAPLTLFRPAKICLWHSGRCGSTVLGDLLNQHSRIYWAAELLETYSCTLEDATDKTGAWRGAQRRIRYGEMKSGSQLFGLEMKLWHLRRMGLSVPDTVQRLRDLGYDRHIVLERENILRIVTSGSVLRHTGRSHVRDPSKRTLEPVAIPLEKIKSSLETVGNFHVDLKATLAPDHLWLTYESDILANPLQAYEKTLAFCGLKTESASVRYQRTNPYPLRDILTNYDEIAAYLASTPHAHMLEE